MVQPPSFIPDGQYQRCSIHPWLPLTSEGSSRSWPRVDLLQQSFHVAPAKVDSAKDPLRVGQELAVAFGVERVDWKLATLRQVRDNTPMDFYGTNQWDEELDRRELEVEKRKEEPSLRAFYEATCPSPKTSEGLHRLKAVGSRSPKGD